MKRTAEADNKRIRLSPFATIVDQLGTLSLAELQEIQQQVTKLIAEQLAPITESVYCCWHNSDPQVCPKIFGQPSFSSFPKNPGLSYSWGWGWCAKHGRSTLTNSLLTFTHRASKGHGAQLPWESSIVCRPSQASNKQPRTKPSFLFFQSSQIWNTWPADTW